MASLGEQPLVNSFNKVFLGAAGTSGEGPPEDEFNRVSFLSHFEGANNGVNNAFDDGSTSNHTISANGNVTQGSFAPFVRPAGHFSQRNHASAGGTTNQTSWVEAPDSADFDLLVTGDFTIEFWVNFLKTEATIIMGQSEGGGGTPKWALTLDQAIADNIAWHLGGGGNLGVPFAPDKNRWYYIALTRDGNNYRFYADGAQLGSTISSSARSSASASPLQIGAGESYLGLEGHISNLRFVKGTALYTGSTHSVPTGPTTKVSNTVLLCCQDNRFLDNSDSGHVLTTNKLTLPDFAEVSSFGPFLTSSVYDPAVNGASAYFDGAGDYLQAANSADFDLGTGNFTWECQAYINDTTRTQWFFSVFNTSSGQNAWGLRLEANGTLNAYFSGDGGESPTVVGVAKANSGLTENAWHHIAVVKNGTGNNNIKVYVDGVSKVTGTFGAIFDTNLPFLVGRQGNSSYTQYFLGYISDVRIIKGTAVYTGNFTPPTAPLSAITNTKMLLNMADGQAIDSAAQTNLTLYGNANTSTDQAKFGNTSLHLDGTGDFVNVFSGSPGHIKQLYNWTIEQWLYPTRGYAANGQQFDRIWGNGETLSSSVHLHFDDTTAPKIVLRLNDNVIWTSSVSISLNAWTHVAAVCDANGTRLYIAGTERATTSTIVNLIDKNFNIGTSITSNGFFQGFMDDFRISEFARYTSNFTAPDAPFADKGQ